MPTNVLITGARGFLAREIARQSPPDWRLAGLLGSRTERAFPGAERFERLHASPEGFGDADAHPDVVLHLAACIPRDMHRFDPRLIASNVELPAQLVRLHPGARHVLASSVSVYGLPASLPISIDTPAVPATPYGWSKLAAESVVRMAASHAVLRLSSIIGPGMRDDSFVPSIVAQARAGRITILGDGSRTQDYIDVRDAARMCIAAARHAANFVTLAVSGRPRSNAGVGEALASLTGAELGFAGSDASPSFAYTLEGAMEPAPGLHSLEDTLAAMVEG